MKIERKLTGRASPEVANQLAALGVAVPESGFYSIWVDETDHRWPAVEGWLRANGRADPAARTRFTKAEVSSSEWVESAPAWQWEYPLPSDDFGYRHTTYDDRNYCPVCGTGLVQVAPFTVRSEPKWGTRNLLQLNWVTDEWFVHPDLWRAIFEPRGVTARDVLGPNGRVLSTVKQLVNDQYGDVDTRGLVPQECSACARVKYAWVTRGASPLPTSVPSVPLLRSAQWFGSGAQAGNMVLASQTLRQALVLAGASGVQFRPCR